MKSEKLCHILSSEVQLEALPLVLDGFELNENEDYSLALEKIKGILANTEKSLSFLKKEKEHYFFISKIYIIIAFIALIASFIIAGVFFGSNLTGFIIITVSSLNLIGIAAMLGSGERDIELTIEENKLKDRKIYLEKLQQILSETV